MIPRHFNRVVNASVWCPCRHLGKHFFVLLTGDEGRSIATLEPVFGQIDVQELGGFEYDYHGKPEKAEVCSAIADSGELQIELVGIRAHASQRVHLSAGDQFTPLICDPPSTNSVLPLM